MHPSGAGTLFYRALWGALIVALSAAIVVWGLGLSRSLRAGTPESAPPTSESGRPRIITVNPDVGLPSIAKLCTEIAPTPTTITIESVSGTILSTNPC
ncbi:MAG TPA: hypothetical protein VHZ81_01030 [Galbitalea sp.]|jgi:hypothetical protein|nr:hypothetical protein [Galbitalea sp.]